jgi:hypothetical protein
MTRRRLGLLLANKCRLPAPRHITLPVPLILNRFATDFLVLTPLGRRIVLFLVDPVFDVAASFGTSEEAGGMGGFRLIAAEGEGKQAACSQS